MEEKDLRDILIETQHELIKQYQDKIFLLEFLLKKLSEKEEINTIDEPLHKPTIVEFNPTTPTTVDNIQYITPQTVSPINPFTHEVLKIVPIRYSVYPEYPEEIEPK